MFVQELTRTKSVSVETQHLPPVPRRHMPKSIHRKRKYKRRNTGNQRKNHEKLSKMHFQIGNGAEGGRHVVGPDRMGQG